LLGSKNTTIKIKEGSSAVLSLSLKDGGRERAWFPLLTGSGSGAV